jgi:hypothetical protein
MKKVIISILLIWMSLTPILANNFSTTLRPSPISIEPGEEFVVNVNVSNMNGIVAIEGNFSYDSTKLQLVQSEFTYNGHDVAVGTRLVVNFKTAKSGSFTAAQLRFRPRPGFSVGQNTIISFSGVSGSNGTTDFSGTSSNTTVNMIPAKSSNNFLLSLSATGVNINFSKNTLNYVADVENSVTSVSITGSVEDGSARVTGLGTFSLNVYENIFNITVTAENGSRRTYTINIRREDELGNPIFVSSSTDIDSLTLSACEINFSNLIDVYQCTVRNDVNFTNVNATSKDSTIKIEAPTIVVLQDGMNTIEVNVVAENDDVRVIVINIERSTDIFTVTPNDAMITLEQISIPILGIQLQEGEAVSAELLNQAFRLSKKLLIHQAGQTILLTVEKIMDVPLLIEFQDLNLDGLSQFNYPIGQSVGLSTPLPAGIRGSWWIEPYLRSFDLKVYDVNDTSSPLRFAVINGILDVDDLTLALFITPATLKSESDMNLPLLIGTGVGGLLIGLLLSLLIKKRS